MARRWSLGLTLLASAPLLEVVACGGRTTEPTPTGEPGPTPAPPVAPIPGPQAPFGVGQADVFPTPAGGPTEAWEEARDHFLLAFESQMRGRLQEAVDYYQRSIVAFPSAVAEEARPVELALGEAEGTA